MNLIDSKVIYRCWCWCDWLIDWCLTPTLAVFQPYRGVRCWCVYRYLMCLLILMWKH